MNAIRGPGPPAAPPHHANHGFPMQPTNYDIDEVLVTPRRLEQRVHELAAEMAAGCKSDNLVLIGVLRGSFIFIADMVRWFYMNDLHPRIDFMIMESYSGTTSRGEPTVSRDFTIDIKGADVVLVDDILDTGRTLTKATAHVWSKGPATVRTCVLLDKPDRRIVPAEADYKGFVIPDLFVVGYGLDYDGRHRELPHIAHVRFHDAPAAEAAPTTAEA
jgi:hypoxanthine phosphoribosyltransferase